MPAVESGKSAAVAIREMALAAKTATLLVLILRHVLSIASVMVHDR